MKNFIKVLLLTIAFSITINIFGLFNDHTIYFSSQDNCQEIIIEEINRAKKSIQFALYLFQDNKIANAIIEAHNRGVKVEGVLQKHDKNTIYKKLSRRFKVKLINRKIGRMHHKFIIIDDKEVITGSYNLTYSANNINDENIALISSKKAVIKFIQEFYRLYR